jgi:hypothetical protein
MSIKWNKLGSVSRRAYINGRFWYVVKQDSNWYSIQRANDGWMTGTTEVAQVRGQRQAFAIAESEAQES